jgi:hypothetical protein
MDQGIIPACADQHPMVRFMVTALPSPKAEKKSRQHRLCTERANSWQVAKRFLAAASEFSDRTPNRQMNTNDQI